MRQAVAPETAPHLDRMMLVNKRVPAPQRMRAPKFDQAACDGSITFHEPLACGARHGAPLWPCT